MEYACIVTDSSAQFLNLSMEQQKLINVVQLPVSINGSLINPKDNYKPGKLPKFASTSNTNTFINAPAPETLARIFELLSKNYQHIFGIFLSSSLNICTSIAAEVADGIKGRINISIIDSKTTSLGLGILVQKIAEKILHKSSVKEIDRDIRLLIPRIYSILCIPGLSYLYNNHFVDLGQAIISEYLGIFPLYTIEEGKISAFDKAKNLRNIVDFYVEFIEEFLDIKDIALLQTAPPNPSLSQLFREQLINKNPNLQISELPINLTLSSLFGPKTSGVFVLDSTTI